ncbi:MAG: VOC family protein [Actinomycetota bacterium]
MVTFTGMQHIHLKVSDIDRSVAFYENGLGMVKMMEKHDGDMVILTTPERGDVVTLSLGSIGCDVDGPGMPGENGGIDHFGFGLADHAQFDQAIDQLVEAGATLMQVTEIAPGWRSAFLRDPDGYAFQI